MNAYTKLMRFSYYYIFNLLFGIGVFSFFANWMRMELLIFSFDMHSITISHAVFLIPITFFFFECGSRVINVGPRWRTRQSKVFQIIYNVSKEVWGLFFLGARAAAGLPCPSTKDWDAEAEPSHHSQFHSHPPPAPLFLCLFSLVFLHCVTAVIAFFKTGVYSQIPSVPQLIKCPPSFFGLESIAKTSHTARQLSHFYSSIPLCWCQNKNVRWMPMREMTSVPVLFGTFHKGEIVFIWKIFAKLSSADFGALL